MSLKILQSTIERLLYVLLLLVFIAQVVTFIKIYRDDNLKFKILKNNQNTLICLVKGPPSLATATQANRNKFIDNCVKQYEK